jgi:tetratricopeptide (TPR) repeat protein
MKAARWLCAIVSLLAGAAAPGAALEAARFVGTAACASCHAAQAKAWEGSHHQLAMAPALRTSVLAPFKGESLTAGGVTSTFTRKGGRFFVRTDGPDGRLHEYAVAHTLGIAPLQQYLVAMPDGSLHALPLAWDARTAAQGGQRWFHLQAANPAKAGDELHWTGRQMNANFMCIECHVTGYRKNFDAKTQRYASRWIESDVGCEACHGAGSSHVDWARRAGTAAPSRTREDPRKGLTITFDERQGARWTIQSATGNAQRVPPNAASQRKEVAACARCHSHRSRIAEDAGPAKPLLDGFHPSLVETGLYWNDGQMRAEVYNQASFQQSRMHAAGVTCGDCHEPHAQKLRAPGNAVCLQCHAAPKYDALSHHFHAAGSPGAQCVACHMPPTNYMTVDARHDHFIRVPQPAQSKALGTPDACTQCHTGKPQSWAVEWTQRRYPRLGERASKMAQALQSLDREDGDVAQKVGAVLGDPAQPALARASVLQRLPQGSPFAWTFASRQLADADPLVRRAAVDALRGAPFDEKTRLLDPLLDDPVRDVRIQAARWLAAPEAQVPAVLRARLARVTREYVAAQEFNADRPESWNNLGTLRADQGDWLSASAALEHARTIAPDSALTALNLADVRRAQGREGEAQSLIRAVLRREPRLAVAWRALGLSLLRQQDAAQALASLRTAHGIDETDPRTAQVYALVLRSQGRAREAVAVAEAALRRHPQDRELLQAAIAVARSIGDDAALARYTAQLERTAAIHDTLR